jgi:hypothetical protein
MIKLDSDGFGARTELANLDRGAKLTEALKHRSKTCPQAQKQNLSEFHGLH